jgi:hypothetical protein
MKRKRKKKERKKKGWRRRRRKYVTYDEIDTVGGAGMMPGGIVLNDDERDMKRVTLVLRPLGEALFSFVYPKP